MLRATLLLLCLLPALAWAGGLNICYHYRCSKHAFFELSQEERDGIATRLAGSNTAASEREAVADVVTTLYRIAARTTPVWQDKGGNWRDGPADGRMDCVDHSSNVSTFLAYLQAQGWLKYHSAAGTAWRAPWLLDLHYTAVLRETASQQDWAVDTWFKDFGEPPVVVPLSIWMKGYEP